jgi:hypothetical protein
MRLRGQYGDAAVFAQDWSCQAGLHGQTIVKNLILQRKHESCPDDAANCCSGRRIVVHE